jgi:hypothetical protein
MIAPEDPPGFVVRTEVQKVAWDNGFRLERGVESGGWLHYASTTARGEIWIAGVPPRGPWLLSIDHTGVAAELATLPPSPLPGPGLATFGFDSLSALHGGESPSRALTGSILITPALADRLWRLGSPDVGPPTLKRPVNGSLRGQRVTPITAIVLARPQFS